MIRVAETAGFCFGVNRAVETVYDLLKQGARVCTLGPIIHNPQLVESLSARGVRTVVLRSHGVPPAVPEKLRALSVPFVDATCPFVQKIHGLVSENSAAGRHLLLAGDAGHPEVQGILGCCRGPFDTFTTAEALEKMFYARPELAKIPVFFCQQTTFNVENVCFSSKRYVQTLPFLIQYVMRPRIVSRRRERSRRRAT